MYSIDNIIEEFRKRGYKITPQRITIVKKLIEKAEEHPSLKQILEEVQRELGATSFSTLYTTALKLQELGIIRLFDFDGSTHIEANIKPHINMIRVDTGEIVDINDPEIIELIARKMNLKEEEREKMLINVLIYP
ncbi:MAG: Fur family transcriptional regulator [Candidatus Asgardarchaeia archaeon]